MDFEIHSTPDELAAAAARLITEQVRNRPDLLLLAPTGNTPIPTYRRLAALHEHGDLPTGRLRVAQLDEYLGVRPGDSRSLYGWLCRELLHPLRIAPERVIRLRGDTADVSAECRKYDAALRAAGGIDLCLLGLGSNGHLGFNEPPSGPDATTREVTLTEETVATNAAYWGNETMVPRRAVTAGMLQILAARRAVLLVSGSTKREILQQVLHGPLTPYVPAGYLRTMRNATVLADRSAFSVA